MQAYTVDGELEAVSKRFDLLAHPFYQRWAAGEVTRDQLACYAAQYAHVVRAIPRWLEGTAARDPRNATALKLHAAEEAEHVALWERFAGALGVDAAALHAAAPNRETAALIANGDELVSRGQGAAVVWSIEAQSPAVSAEKLRGLRGHYGIDAQTGGEYFALHQQLDREHEAQLRDVIHSYDAQTAASAPAAAKTTLAGMWDLLSSMQLSGQ